MKTFGIKEEDNINKMWRKNISVLYFVASLLVLLIFSLEAFSLIISKRFLDIWFVGFIGGVSISTVNYFKSLYDLRKKKINEIIEKYPYVDADINIKEVEESLKEAKIIKCEHRDGLCCMILDETGYENYLKCEEIKEKYLEEIKYKGYEVNPSISEEELAKPKIKKLVR